MCIKRQRKIFVPLFLCVALAVLIVPSLVSAIVVESQTIVYSTGSGSTIRFEQDTTLDLRQTTSEFTALHNVSTLPSTYTNINATTDGKLNFYGLPNGVSLTLSGGTAVCGVSDTCDSNENVTIPVGQSVTLATGGGALVCSTFTKTGYKLIMIFASLILVVFVGMMLYNKGLEGFTMGQFIIIFVAIAVGVAMWLASGQTLGASCPVVT